MSSPPQKINVQEEREILSKSNPNQSTIPKHLTTSTSTLQETIGNDESTVKTVTNDNQKEAIDISGGSTSNKTENILTQNISAVATDIVSDPSSTDTNDENRSSPIESIGKG